MGGFVKASFALSSCAGELEELRAELTVSVWDVGTSQSLQFFGSCRFCTNPSGSSPWFCQAGCWVCVRSRWDEFCTLAATKAWLLFGQGHHPGKARGLLSI